MPPQNDNKLLFFYDASGNQTTRQKGTTVEARLQNQDDFLEHIQLFPVPVQNELTIKWDNEVNGQIFSIGIYDHNQLKYFYKEYLNNNEGQVNVNMSTYNSGLYVIQFSLTDGKVYSKTIIKK